MRLNPEHLMTFSVVAEYGSVSRAAAALNLSQPAVSGQLRALQEQVGQPLYERRSRGIVLTAAGEQLVPYAGALARNVRLAGEQIQALQRRPERLVRVGLSYALAGWAAPLSQLAGPGLLKFRAGLSQSLVERLQQGELDVALVVAPVHLPERMLEGRTLAEDELRLIVPAAHPLADAGYTPPHSLQGECLLWASSGSGVRAQAQRLLEQSGVVPERNLELGSLDAVRAALLGGYGAALLPGGYVRHEVRAGLLASVGLEAPRTTVTYLLVTAPSQLLPPEVAAFTQRLGQWSPLGEKAPAQPL